MTRVSATRLARIMEGALRRRGLPDEHAAFVVDGLLEASLRGVDTHGVRLFPTYLAELDGGRSRARPEMRWLGSAAAARVLDAGHALGIVAGRVACDEAVRLAKQNGVGTVAVRNSNHFGPASCYTLAMARQGALGLALTNSDALVAPYNGRLPFFGTNPISLAVLGEGEDTFCADFATSQVSYSRVKRFREEGRPLAPGWALTPDGQDAAASPPREGGAEEIGALQPLGGHKGECLGMMVEVLSAVLAGMPFDHELTHLYAPPYDEPRRVAHLFIAFDLPAFGDPDQFRERLSRLMGLVRDQPAAPAGPAAPAASGERVLVPGDPESEAAADRRQHGIPLSAGEWAWFETVEREDAPAGC